MSTYVREVKSIVAPVFSIGYKLQKQLGSINLEGVKTLESGLWQSTICVNAQTRVFHTEADSTYTIITVPPQKKQQVIYSFLFKINKYTTLTLKMNPGLSFFFSAKFLTHRQERSQTTPVQEQEPFYNLSSYGNGKLFRHCRCSFQRNIMEKEKRERGKRVQEEAEVQQRKRRRNKQKYDIN